MMSEMQDIRALAEKQICNIVEAEAKKAADLAVAYFQDLIDRKPGEEGLKKTIEAFVRYMAIQEMAGKCVKIFNNAWPSDEEIRRYSEAKAIEELKKNASATPAQFNDSLAVGLARDYLYGESKDSQSDQKAEPF